MRRASVERNTTETRIKASVDLDGTGEYDVATGIGFLDHMITAMAFYARFDLTLSCEGDVNVDDHHTAEDCAIALGRAIDAALASRDSIVRYGSSLVPMDESLAQVALDLGGRIATEIHLGLTRDRIGSLACENITHFFETLGINMRATLHIDLVRGHNDHHRAEAAFKAVGFALREAVSITTGVLPSTKGVLD
ncbi:MAG: imidazoleglycerol-phosphate dehydratase HisB [Proteobacteria bacterium]|nr:imidazoleglycerol-phosphate dehydratase HisB [Pseudomonadota bacterium]